MVKNRRQAALLTLAAGTALLSGAAHAQSRKTVPSAPQRFAAAPGEADIVKVERGGKVVLPYQGVTRIITMDDEVARASFASGRAVIEGTGMGDTTVEVYQGTETPRLLSIRVVDQGQAGTRVAAVPNDVTPMAPEPATLPPVASPISTAPIAPARSPLTLSLRVAPVQGVPGQAEFTLLYGNPGQVAAQNAIVRFTLDESVSYVSNSASNGGRYDPAQREVVWNVGNLAAGSAAQKLTLRVEPIERGNVTFDSVATIEDATGSAIVSNQVRYSTATTPLLTVFAIPDRFLAGKMGAVLVDVKGIEFQSAVDRLQQLGVVSGRQPGLFYPDASTRRAEYAVMTLNGLNLRDLRDVTQIKFVLGRRSTVDLVVQNSAGKVVSTLVRNTTYDPGEHTAVWNGRVGTGFAAPGRYTYICTARGSRGEQTVLKGFLNIVPQTPLMAEGKPSFVDVKNTDWYAGYLAVAEKQGLVYGYQDKTFRPGKPINRVEATAIVVRALGLEDVAKQWADKDVGFLDYQNIEPWARGYVNVASTVAKTGTGKPIMRGKPSNFFEPTRDLRRDEAALIVQRLIDRETDRRVTVSGAIVPGAMVTINSHSVQADPEGRFSFSVQTNTSSAMTVAVIDTRDR